MDFFVVVALVGVVLLLAELLLPTGGVLAVLGALGLMAAGVLALDSGAEDRDVIGPALIALGALSLVASYVIARKVLAAHRDEPVRTGAEELVGALAEVRSTLGPEGQVWIEGALWRARIGDGEESAQIGDRVRVEAIEGLTLRVRPEPATGPADKGAS